MKLRIYIYIYNYVCDDKCDEKTYIILLEDKYSIDKGKAAQISLFIDGDGDVTTRETNINEDGLKLSSELRELIWK